jgi:NAD(P)-dependent dehydrogenase (short-subunit alcohol dehydrogenase family)
MIVDLTGRKAMVTGSTWGIGRATAASFARAGAEVVINGRDDGRTADAVKELRAETGSAQVTGVAADVGSADGAAALIAEERPTSLLGRLIRPEEIANMITYVASELSSSTTGAALRADGGVAPTIIP